MDFSNKALAELINENNGYIESESDCASPSNVVALAEVLIGVKASLYQVDLARIQKIMETSSEGMVLRPLGSLDYRALQSVIDHVLHLERLLGKEIPQADLWFYVPDYPAVKE